MESAGCTTCTSIHIPTARSSTATPTVAASSLLHRKQIDYLDGKLRTRGVALVPLELYFNEDGRVKLLLGLGRGKKLYDKREDMAKRDMQREIDRALKQRSRRAIAARGAVRPPRGTMLPGRGTLAPTEL